MAVVGSKRSSKTKASRRASGRRDGETNVGGPSGAHAHPPADMITTGDLLAGATMPVRLRLNVTIRPGSAEEVEESGEPANQRRPARTLEARLGRHMPKLLKWAQRDPANARVLLLDPVSAMDRARIKLPPQDRGALERHMNALIPGEVLPAGVELTGLTVNIVTKKRPTRGADAAAPASPIPAKRGGSNGGSGRTAARKRGGHRG